MLPIDPLWLVGIAGLLFCCFAAFSVEYANNQQRTPAVLLLDTSKSTEGDPNEEMNRGYATYIDELCRDSMARVRSETEVWTFGDGGVRCVQMFAKPEQLTKQRFGADGQTPLGEAITKSLDSFERRLRFYAENGVDKTVSPFVIVCDGGPNDAWETPIARLHELESKGKIATFVIAVGPDADMETLTKIAPPHRPPLKLDGLKFVEFFKWLTETQSAFVRTGHAKQVALTPVNGWAAVNNK